MNQVKKPFGMDKLRIQAFFGVIRENNDSISKVSEIWVTGQEEMNAGKPTRCYHLARRFFTIDVGHLCRNIVGLYCPNASILKNIWLFPDYLLIIY